MLKNAVALFENQKFDIVSLYRLLMDTKRRVFLGDKARAMEVNVILALAIDFAMEYTEAYIRQMAIDTIFSDKNDVDILWPPRYMGHSETERAAEEKILSDLGVRFGLADVDSERKLRFLHRTYAEYLVAEYIYKGFLEDKRRSGLLNLPNVQEFVMEEILVKSEYEGVRVFFDMMLKEVLNDDRRCRIIFLNKEPINESSESSPPITLERTPIFNKKRAFESIATAGKESNTTTFNFLMIYFEARYGKTAVQDHLASFDFHQAYCFLLCSEASCRIFEYCDGAPDHVVKELLGNLSLNHHSVLHRESRNTLQSKEIFKEMMTFMEMHWEVIQNDQDLAQNLFTLGMGKLNNMFLSIVFEEYYASELERFLCLLSRILPSNSNAIINLFREIISSK